MRPLDPRLLRYARSTRRYLVVAVLVGAVTAALVVVQAWLLADVVDRGFLGGSDVADLRGPLVALALVLAARAGLLWLTETAAHRSSARVKSELRAGLLDRAVETGPYAAGRRSTGDLVTLATRGVDALDAYFARFLPQVVLAVVVPITVVAVLLGQDLVAALVVGLTLPLVPLFMVLVGMATRSGAQRRLRGLQRLSSQFLDLVEGLPTLKVFGLARGQAQLIRSVTDTYRRSTMTTLRLAFLSSLVLELLASLSVALVAVSVGLRLVGSELDFRTGLFVLVLAPEAYLPLRQLGASFHASADGVAAVEQVVAVLEEPLPVPGTRTEVPDPSRHPLELVDLRVRYPGRDPLVVDGFSLRVEPGTTVALTGPSGAGKSTVLAVVLGLLRPESGAVTVGGVPLDAVDPDAWRSRLAWVPQRPYLFAGSLADNVRLGRPEATDAQVREAVAAAGLDRLVAGRRDGLDTTLGERGAGLSGGERQRVALARAFLRDAPLLLLDEPTAALDSEAEGEVLDAVERLARGRTVLLVAHRPALVGLADRVVPVGGPVLVGDAS